MSFKKRPTSFGNYSGADVDNRKEGVVLRGDPLSSHFSPPAVRTASDLFNYLVACQVRNYGSSFYHDNMPVTVGVRHMRNLLTKHDALLIQRAIILGCKESKHPFSVVYIRTKIEWLQENYPELT